MMGLYVVFGALAAFGLLCALWVALGGLLNGGQLLGLCRCESAKDGLKAVRRWYWLRNTGLVSGCLILVDCGLTPEERETLQSIGPWIEICDRDSLSLSELERT